MNDSAESSRRVIAFGVFEFDLPSRELRKQGRLVHLQEQPSQILEMLLAQPGEVVTREELQHALWPESVYVDFDHGLNNAVARLRDVLGDHVTSPQFIETVPRRGYRFVYPVLNGPGAIPRRTELPPEIGDAKPRANWWTRALLATAAAALLALAGFGAWRALAPRADAWDAAVMVTEPPALAVLPFTSLGPDSDGEHFADGLTEELVAKLVRIRGLRVAARTSSGRFREARESAAAVAEALGVEYLLEGAVRRSGDRLRITAQLVDAREDEHVWSQTFDRAAGDIFQIQEEIAFAVAAALKVALLESDEMRVRKRGTGDPEAYRLYLIAQSHLLHRTRTSDPNVAKRSLEAAIARDPRFAAAYAGLARHYFTSAWSALADAEESARLGAAAAARAVDLDPASSEARQANANFLFWRYRFRGDFGAYVEGQHEMQRAIELDPTNSPAFEDFGRAILWNEPDVASSLFEQAIELDLLCTGPHVMVAVLLASRGQLAAAEERCASLLERSPDALACRMALATIHAAFGRLSDARNELVPLEKSIGGPARIALWSLHLALGDRAGAEQWLDFGRLDFEKPLSGAARLAMQGRHAEAHAVLEQGRAAIAPSLLLDFPAAKFALIAGKPERAREILEQRVPDLARGIEPISARNLLPAIDLAAAWLQTGVSEPARALLLRVAEYLDGPAALRLPLFTFERARVHALLGEPEATLRALDRAFDQGFRTSWAVDLRPQSHLYIDPIEADPAFDAVRAGYEAWLARVGVANVVRADVPPREPDA